eukprot:TRINITY_DN13025_c0_g1_i3.p1 TRINITY_DN13025_c0_g1~~TRINITY_DN13025_c0_g1_i3.p1  ORF type:complete len:840 (-),score=297.96 TRINITY_DN13025_c0_g1_i3:186-2705(-)
MCIRDRSTGNLERASMSRLSREWKVSTAHTPIFTGGNVRATSDGRLIATSCTTAVKLLDGASSNVLGTVEGDGEAITTFALRPDGEELVMCTQSFRVRQYSLPDGTERRNWAGHNGVPVLDAAYDATGGLVATGAADRLVRVWDSGNGACTHNLKGHEGIIEMVKFHPDPHRLQLVSSSEDGTVRVWDLVTRECVGLLEAHVSAVPAFDFSPCGNRLVSGGRDKIMAVWDLRTFTRQAVYPVHESIEAVCLLPEEHHLAHAGKSAGGSKPVQVVLGGEKGQISVWNGLNGQCLHREEQQGGVELTGLLLIPGLKGMELLALRADQALLFYSLAPTVAVARQLLGFIDQVIDIKYCNEASSRVVVASNSEEVQLLQLEDLGCQVLAGHTGLVLSVDVSCDFKYVASSSKDNTVRVWDLDSGTCVGVGTGHTEAVGVVAWPSRSSNFVVSGSKDRTLKLWNTKKMLPGTQAELKVSSNCVAHDKDINAIAVAPNDSLFATGSQDKTIKIWPLDSGLNSPSAILKGHKRGVWSLAFSPVDKCLASGSGDSKIKLWSMGDWSCIKTLEGHSASVLRVGFITAGMQLVSCGGDGLLKVWTIKTNECVSTFDEHSDKVWAMAVHPDQKTLVTGGSDSTINVWADVTSQVDEEAVAADEAKELQRQELSNAARSKDYKRAVQLALQLEHPHQMYKLLEEMLGAGGAVQTVLLELPDEQLLQLLHYVRGWNAKAKQSEVAQAVLGAVLGAPGATERLMGMEGLKPVLEGLIPYSDRHLQRVNKLLRGSYFLDYVVQGMALQMDPEPVPEPKKRKAPAVEPAAAKSAKKEKSTVKKSTKRPTRSSTKQ